MSGGYLDPLGNIFGPLSSIRTFNSIANSYVNELKNKDITKEIKK